DDQECADRRRVGAAAGEDPLLDPGRRRHQGGGQRLQGAPRRAARRSKGELKFMGVSLSEAAARHVTRYIAKRGRGVGVRLGVKTTGCSGLAYKLEYADDI